MKFTEVRDRKELKSDGRKWRGEGKQKRKQDNHSKLGAGGWFKINDLHEGKKEEERGEGEKVGAH